MPRQLVLSQVPVHLSIVEFALDAGEDIFLTYTWERKEGPEIRRTGKGPPEMKLIGGQPGQTTTHQFGLRLGTWLIEKAFRKEELESAREELNKARTNRAPQPDIDVLQSTIDELPSIRAHDAVFIRRYPSYEILGQQGCGDLTMNAWNVAYVNNGLSKKPPELVCLPQEPLEDRTYSCLVKWKPSESGARRVTIEEVRFRHPETVRTTNELVWVQFADQWLPRADLIEFAVSNQQVIRHGELVSAVTSCHQFGDLRHLLQLPNLNPVGPLYPGEQAGPNGGYRPRQYFNQEQFGDIWLGEEAFLQDQTQNLLRAALAGPVFLNLPAGAYEQRLRGSMEVAGYSETTSALKPLVPGDWRFVRRDSQVTVLEIYFKRNTYGWTMIGLSSDNRRIICMACTGTPGKTGYLLEQAAEILFRAGAREALLIDEGADVFQQVRWSNNQITEMVPRIRRRVRATFIFAKQKAEAS